MYLDLINNNTSETRRLPVSSVTVIIAIEWLQGGCVESQKITMDAQKAAVQGDNMTYYTIQDFIVGESGDPAFPAFVGLGPCAMKTTYTDYGFLVAMMTNQNRRFGRQQQLKERGDLSNNPTLRNSDKSNGGCNNV